MTELFRIYVKFLRSNILKMKYWISLKIRNLKFTSRQFYEECAFLIFFNNLIIDREQEYFFEIKPNKRILIQTKIKRTISEEIQSPLKRSTLYKS